MEELVLRNIRKFVQHLGEPHSLESTADKETPDHEWSSPKNMTEWADYLSFDIMGDICFSGSFQMLDEPGNRYVLDVLPRGVNGLNIVSRPSLCCSQDLVSADLEWMDARYSAFEDRQRPFR